MKPWIYLAVLMVSLCFLRGQVNGVFSDYRHPAKTNAALSNLRETRLHYFETSIWQNDEWIFDTKSEYVYGANGLPEEIINYYRNNNSWYYSSRELVEYDASEHWNHSVIQIWSGGWADYYQILLNWDGDQVQDVLVQTYNNQWINNQYNTYFYTDDLLDEVLLQNWDGSNWYNVYLYQFAYYPNDLAQFLATSQWDGSSWYLSYRDSLAYDAQENCILELSQSNLNNLWINDEQLIHTYNAGNQVNTLKQYWYIDEWYDMNNTSRIFDGSNVQEELNQEWDGALWQNLSNTLYTYEIVASEHVLTPALRVSCYPNPARIGNSARDGGIVFLASGIRDATPVNISVYDCKGRFVRSVSGEGGAVRWDGRNSRGAIVSGGVYLYRAEVDGVKMQGKLLLLK